jgi:pyrroloquinoline quinone biosynthesis protein E
MTAVEPPLALLAELTHRCPLRCPYCSNPLELSRASAELDTATWKRVLGEAADLGVLGRCISGVSWSGEISSSSSAIQPKPGSMAT